MRDGHVSVCPHCGGNLLGDGFSVVIHCERVDVWDVESDALPVYCEKDCHSVDIDGESING